MPHASDPFAVHTEGGEITDRRIDRDRRAFDVSESLTDPTARTHGHIRTSRSVFIAIILFVGVSFFLLIGRLVFLQVTRGAYYRAAAEENRINIEQIPPTRGLFYDVNGELLVKNVPNFEVRITPTEFSFSEHDTLLLQEAAKLGEGELEAILAEIPPTSSVPVVIRSRMGYDDAIIAEIKLGSLPGAAVVAAAERQYPRADAFAHILGYVGKISEDELLQYPEYGYEDIVGKTGLENIYEESLHGIAGEQQVERDFLNNQKRTIARTEAVAGADAYVTLDASLQQATYDALRNAVETLQVPGAAAVVLDPRNGAVRAMVSYPSYDPNAFIRGLTPEEQERYFSDEQALFNRAISGEYPSGSTIKPAIATAALSEGIITPRTTVQSTGGLRVGQWFFPDWRAGGHGTTNVYHAIADSVNTFFYTIGGGYEDFTGLGVDRITAHLKQFGLSETLGIDLPGEQNGFLPSKTWKEETKGERWYIGDTYNLSIGQGDLLVTPLQMASITATIANGGVLYRPHLLERLVYPDQTEKRPEETVISFQVEDADSIAVVQDALRQTVTDGSARSLSDLPVAVAAKTGTAQFGDGSKTHAWFTAYAPFENPEIALAVIIEQGGEGSSTAAPIARAILKQKFGLQ